MVYCNGNPRLMDKAAKDEVNKLFLYLAYNTELLEIQRPKK